jgi:hypothetical protein
MALVLLGLLAGLRSGRTRWLLAAGAAAGLAGAVKYLGITVVAVPVMAVFTQPALSWSRRLGRSALVMLVAGLTFAAGTLGTAVRGTAFLRGFADQLAHQSAGHLGYEAEGPGWLFHATTSLPGSWGWPLTIAAAAGVVLVALRGTRAQRLTAAYAAGLYSLVGMSRIAFPHYVLVVTPLLAALACVALARLAAALPRQVAVAAIALVIASLVPSLGNDLRLRRLDDAPRTTELAGVVAAGLPGPVWSDHSTGVAEPARTMFSLSERAEETLGCDCYAVLSSLQEERYRRLPRRYAREVAGYDALREAGTVVAVVEPSLPLSYRWDVLPQWGLARIPLRGPLPTVGPTVTILDLRAPGRLARQTGAAVR